MNRSFNPASPFGGERTRFDPPRPASVQPPVQRTFKELTMKRLFIRTSAGAGLLATLAFAPMATMAQHKCDQPASTIDRRACAKAAEGPDALREFVFRTRMIWGLYYWDYAPRQEQVTQAREAVKPASVETGEPRKVVKSE